MSKPQAPALPPVKARTAPPLAMPVVYVDAAANGAAQQMPHTLNARCLPYAATMPTHRAAPVRLAPLAPFPTADHSHRGYS